jgi:phosphatidylinositol alpha-mannosyltransferase
MERIKLKHNKKRNTAFLFESLTKELTKAIVAKDEKRKALAEAGRAHAQRFDWSLVANQVYEIYEMALASGEKLNVTSDSRAWDWLLIREND